MPWILTTIFRKSIDLLIRGQEIMIIRDAYEKELPVLRELRINAYKEHEHKINQDHWKVLNRQISLKVEMHPDVEQLVAEIDGKLWDRSYYLLQKWMLIVD